jgi:TRAP-type C4-dicarboxylate transport system permease small subunit
MDRFSNSVKWVTSVLALVAGICLLLIVVATVVDVSSRPLRIAIPGIYELSRLFIAFAVSLSFAYTTRERGHVVITLLVERFPLRTQRRISIVSSSITTCVIGLMIWANVGILHSRWLAERTDILRIPFLPARFAFEIGLFLFCLVLIIDIYATIKELRSNKISEPIGEVKK